MLGRSATYELAVAQTKGIPIYFQEMPDSDLPIYIPQGAVIEPKEMVQYITQHGSLPPLETDMAELNSSRSCYCYRRSCRI